MAHDDSDGTFVESCGQRYRVMVLEDFRKFRSLATDTDGWTTHFSDPLITVQTKPPPGGAAGGLNMVRVRREMKSIAPLTLYNNFHDAEYRKTWDANMLAGYNICDLNKHNDIGYYGAKFPWPLANRDFCNMRSWMEFTNGEYVIFNHSVPHNDCPPKKGFVRAKSIITGYYVQPIPGNANGCTLIYVTHTDLEGSIPYSIINIAMQKGVPGIMNKIEECASKYVHWAKERYSDSHVHAWRTPQIDWESKLDYPPQAGGVPLVETKGVDPLSTSGPRPTTPPTAVNEQQSAHLNNNNVSSSQHDAALPASSDIVKLQKEVAELQRQLLLAAQGSGDTGFESRLSLAPVAPSHPNDPAAVQQYRAIMQDTLTAVDRLYVQEGRVPTAREYLTRVHHVLEGLRKTMPR